MNLEYVQVTIKPFVFHGQSAIPYKELRIEVKAVGVDDLVYLTQVLPENDFVSVFEVTMREATEKIKELVEKRANARPSHS